MQGDAGDNEEKNGVDCDAYDAAKDYSDAAADDDDVEMVIEWAKVVSRLLSCVSDDSKQPAAPLHTFLRTRPFDNHLIIHHHRLEDLPCHDDHNKDIWERGYYPLFVW